MEGLRKPTKSHNQDSLCQGQNLNQAPSEYMPTAFPLDQASATYGTHAKRGTWNDFQWHAE
jgi:hypothetical protein